jgi:hypothetical protein
LIVESKQIPVSFINIHAKAFSDEASYARRRDASIGLKNLLDGSAYNTKKLVIIGDFNDYLKGTQCGTCGGISPYKNFMDDVDNYKGLTTALIHPYYGSPTIDNVIISNELFDSYLNNSALTETSATQTIPNYYSTTSSHYPVSVMFRITENSNIIDMPTTSSLKVYPNPTTGELIIENNELTINKIEIIDLSGKTIKQFNQSTNKVNVSDIANGVYFIKIETGKGIVIQKIVKE